MTEAHPLYARITAGKPVVLLVDDDPNILDTSKDILEDAGYEIVTAAKGAEAVAKIEEREFNVVVVDFQLPDATGLELARKVHERSEHTVVILMTGHASLEMAVKAIKEAVYDYLIKPVDPAQLKKTMEKAIEKQRLSLENRQLLADLQTANQAMARFDSLKSKMLTVLSHDLKTPLASIRGYSDLLRSGVKGKLTDNQKRMVEITIQESDNLNGLIGDLLDLASIDSGSLNLEKRPIAFDEVVQKVLPRVKLVSEMKEIPVEVSLPAPLPEVEVDVPRVVQVITNLLRSALKHASRGTRVYLNVVEKGMSVELKITYNGQGFTPEQLKSIFEWSKAPGEPNSAQDGLRIAMALGREILHAHGGDIQLESRGGEHGTTFSLRLPIMKMDATGAASKGE